MDIKDLNKSQLILLAVLLSFITSIATGITTVTLMQQAPASFTAPINRVIQQTVEKIQKVEGKTTVQTVIIKEEDLVVDAIAKNKSSIFTIRKEALNAEGIKVEVPAGRGFAVSDGIIVVDGNLVPEQGNYFAKNDSGTFKADFISKDPSGFSTLKLGVAVNGTDKLAFTVPTFKDLGKMKIGQKVLVLGSGVSSFIFDGDKNIKINESNAGAVALDLDGNVLGIASSQPPASFVPINVISSALKLKLTENSAATLPAAATLAPLPSTPTTQ